MRKMRLLISLSEVISISHLQVSSQNHARTGNNRSVPEIHLPAGIINNTIKLKFSIYPGNKI
jgi:hypothetical protein